MTIWTPDLAAHPGPRYQALADAIARAIETGELPPGSRLPTHRDLAYRLGCTVGTVSRAYALAEQRGLIAGQVGRGTFVRERPGEGADPAGGSGLAHLLLSGDGSEPVVDLARNLPNLGLSGSFLRSALAEAGNTPFLGALLGYPPAAGHVPQREAVARWVARHGIVAGAENVVLTAGTQQALSGALMAMLRPGQVLLCEEPSYAGLRDIAALTGVRLHGVAMDWLGMQPDALARAARETGARVAIVTPVLQNPTTVTMDEARRAEIADCARRHDLLLIEDDVYGDLPKARPQALAALIPERVIYVGSLSKCLAPALRLGWAVSTPVLAQRVAEAIGAMSLNTSPLSAELGRLWLAQGAPTLPALREDIALRQRIARTALAGLEILGDPEALHLVLLLPPPWTGPDFVAAARELGIRAVPLEAFHVAGSTGRPGVRLTLTMVPDPADLGTALERLAALVRRGGPAADQVI